MTDRAPGLDPPKTGGVCFNCGSQDHFAYACPEPVRKDPHGAGVFRQLQAERSMSGHKGRNYDSLKANGGLVVTRYAPPPASLSQYPPPPTNSWGSGGPYPPPLPAVAPPPRPYSQQLPPLPYPPSNHAQPAYPPSYPPASGSYPSGPSPPPPTPGPALAFGQYPSAPYRPSPPLPKYGPPGAYPPAPYGAPYPPPPKPPYPGSTAQGFPSPPPPASLAQSYPPPYGSSLPPIPPPPPGTYPPPLPPPGYEPPASYAGSYPPPPTQSWEHELNGYVINWHKDRRDHRNDRDSGGKSNKQYRRDNDRVRGPRLDQGKRLSAELHQQTLKLEIPVKAESVSSKLGTPKIDQPAENKMKKEDEKAEKVERAENEEDVDENFQWDLEKAFVELEYKPGDPVGKPLAAEWNEDPTIPPAFNAKCIKTAFYDPDNPDAFLASARDSKYWPDLQRDPVFRYRRGMVVVQFPGSHHEYFTYHCSRSEALFKDREVIPVPSDPALNDTHVKPRIANRTISPVKRFFRDDEYTRRDAKRIRQSPNGWERTSPPRRRDYEAPSRASHPGEGRGFDSPRGHRPTSAGERDRVAPYHIARRNDSCYNSTYREEKGGQQQRHLLQSPSIRKREASRGRSASYSRIGGGSRSRTRSPPLRSRSRSSVADSASDSGMSDLDYALLGLSRPKKKKSPVKATAKKPRVKVNDAYSRRW